MPLWTLATAAALSSPNLLTLLHPNDYPQWAMRTDKSVAAVLEITLDPKGKVLSCTRQEYFGDEKLADSLCRIVSSRKIQAATAADGSSSYFKARTLMTMFLPDTPIGDKVARVKRNADITIDLPSMPEGLTSNASGVTVAIDENGRIGACVEKDALPGQVLVKDACQYLSSVSMPPLLLSDGRRVPYVSALSIQFKAKN